MITEIKEVHKLVETELPSLNTRGTDIKEDSGKKPTKPARLEPTIDCDQHRRFLGFFQ
jgi:hypothetical protein